MMNFFKIYKLVFLLFCIILFSCSKDKIREKSKKAEITLWKFSKKEATIKGKDISITLPDGTDITNLEATVRISAGASIEPDPKKALDYTRPLSFVVTAEDGTSMKTYKVKVNIEQDKRAEIISWKFLDKKATIEGKDISITLPFGTDLTNLKAEVEISPGASISPDPTKTQDYTTPLKFIVTAKDGKTKKTYTVTVNVAKNTEAKIISWKFLDKKATIKGTDISITLPYLTDVKNLKAEVEISPEASISPDPKNPLNYTKPLDFVVTAKDGKTKKTYTVTVSVAKNTDAEIISWKFLDKKATIKGTDISITLPYGTDLTNLKAEVEISAGASINPDPTKTQDYTKPLDFVVTAEDGKTKKTYTVTVSVAKNTEAKITSFKFGGKTATIKGTDISITLPFGTDLKNLTATVKISPGASINPDPTKTQDYTKPLDFVVTAEDGKTKKTYTVTVSLETSLITSWTAGWRDDDAYTAKIDYKTNKIKIDVNSADFDTKVTLLAEAKITPDPNKVNNWEKEVSFTVSKKGYTAKTYKVKVTVNGKDIIKAKDSNIKSIVNTEINKLGNTANFNHIDVSSVTNMKELFKEKKSFNGDITKWDVSKVTTMSYMFRLAKAFNQDIGKWDVSNVTNMQYMFSGFFYFMGHTGFSHGIVEATLFNQDIGSWNVSNVINMSHMFTGAEAFNQDIGKWDVSKVTNMSLMFFGAKAFNQNIGGWDVSKVNNMSAMFDMADAFNQNIGGWDVSNVKNMSYMFHSADAFNQDIGSWKVSNVKNMSYMFSDAKVFNQDIGKWDVSNVTDMTSMFKWAYAFNQNIGGWDVSKVTNMNSMFREATAFNQDIGKWDVSNVTNMSMMFFNVKSFNQNLSKWTVT